MAKLSAHGRTEIFRLVFIVAQASELKEYRTLMSDGSILYKMTKRMPNGRTESLGGWRERSKLKPDVTPALWHQQMITNGWKDDR